jgi:hypothetical protein
VFTQRPPHSAVPGGHVTVVHAPRTHVALAGHALPHIPQFARSDCVSTHVPEQLTVPAGHIPID